MSVRIGIVDDSDIARRWAQSHLKAAGYSVVTYAESLGIQGFVTKHRPDVLLLDVNMPALNGNIVCQMLKRNRNTKHVRILLYSSMSPDELDTMASSAGADGYICKTKDASVFTDSINAEIQNVPPKENN